MLLSSWASRTDREESSTVAVTLATISVPFTTTVTFRSEGKSTLNDASVSTSVDAGIRYPGNVVHVTVRNASSRGPHVVFPAPPSTSSSTPFDGTVNTVCTSADAENPLFRTLAWYTSTDPRVIRAGDDPRSVKNAARSACSTVLNGTTAVLSDRSASGRDCDTEAVSALVPKNCGIKFTVSSITCPAARGVTVVHVTVSTANVHVPVGHVYPTYVDGCGSSTVITMSVAVLGPRLVTRGVTSDTVPASTADGTNGEMLISAFLLITWSALATLLVRSGSSRGELIVATESIVGVSNPAVTCRGIATKFVRESPVASIPETVHVTFASVGCGVQDTDPGSVPSEIEDAVRPDWGINPYSTVTLEESDGPRARTTTFHRPGDPGTNGTPVTRPENGITSTFESAEKNVVRTRDASLLLGSMSSVTSVVFSVATVVSTRDEGTRSVIEISLGATPTPT